MKVVPDPSGLESLMGQASSEAAAAFGDPTVYMEKYLGNPRHIEFQIFGDGKGNAIHLGERDCSIQRRYQKVLEESPSAFLTPALRAQMGAAAVQAAKAIDYKNAGKQPDDKNQGYYQFNRGQANRAQSIQAFTGLCWTLRRVIVILLRLACAWLPLPSLL